VVPGVRTDAVKNPDQGQRFEQPRPFDPAHINHRPAESSADLSHLCLGIFIISANEHIRGTAREPGIDHMSIADHVEGFDNPCFRKPALDLLAR